MHNASESSQTKLQEVYFVQPLIVQGKIEDAVSQQIKEEYYFVP